MEQLSSVNLRSFRLFTDQPHYYLIHVGVKCFFIFLHLYVRCRAEELIE